MKIVLAVIFYIVLSFVLEHFIGGGIGIVLAFIIGYVLTMRFGESIGLDKISFLPKPAIEAAGVEFQTLMIIEDLRNNHLESFLPPDRRLPTQREYQAFMNKFGFTGFRRINNIDHKVVAIDSGDHLLTVNCGSTSIYR